MIGNRLRVLSGVGAKAVFVIALALAMGVSGLWSAGPVLAQTAEESSGGGLPVPRPRPADFGAAKPAENTDADVPIEALDLTAPLLGRATPYAPPPEAAISLPEAATESALYLVAKLEEAGKPINSGLVWRVFKETAAANGKLEMVATATGGDAEFRLQTGSYLVHAAYGRAGATSRVTVGSKLRSETLILNAGGIKLEGVIGRDVAIEPENLFFDIFATESDDTNGGKLILKDVKPGRIVRLNAGTYHVVSRFGAVNAVRRADIQVEAGKLTEATIFHEAARITLKLVAELGGEALANTSWTVLSPGGDVVVESVGAFPDFVLAEGDYSVIAKHAGTVYNKDFSVEDARDREVEVLAKKIRSQ